MERKPGIPVYISPMPTWVNGTDIRKNHGDGLGITAFLVPMTTPGVNVEEYLWTFNMPSDHARVSFTEVRVPHSAIFGKEGYGLAVVQHFFNENRIRQAASSLGGSAILHCRSSELRQ